MADPVSLGAGLSIFSGCGVVIAAIIKFVPSRNGNGKRITGETDRKLKEYVRKDVLNETIKRFDERFATFDRRFDDLDASMKRLLKATNVD